MNPFITIGYAGPEYFCDRKEETERIIRHISDGMSISLTSVRRMGKTGLIRHVLSKMTDDFITIYVDIQPAENLTDFLNILASSLLKAAPEKSKLAREFIDFLKTLRPVFSFDPLSGIPQVSIESNQRQTEPDIDAILNFLETRKKRIVIAIDEFQQILNFPEKNVDAWLRSRIQGYKNISFLFSGSVQHIIEQMFSHPSKPFYRSTLFLKLGKINKEEYKNFIIDIFTKNHRIISDTIVEQMIEWANGHTYYVQLLCNQVYSTGIETISSEIWKKEASILIREAGAVFFHYRSLITKAQWLLLRAIAEEKEVMSPTSKRFIQKHGLSGSATVLQSLKALLDKELIYKDVDTEDNIYYSVYDVLFMQWIRNGRLNAG